MSTILIRLFFIVICLAVWPSEALRAQANRLFTTEHSLTSSLINHLYQDRKGMLWISTEEGLNRYDGTRFTQYRHVEGDAHSLSHNYVNMVMEDTEGHLLVSTYKGVQCYDPATDRFSLLATQPNGEQMESNVRYMVLRQNGEVWSSGTQLFVIKVNDGQPTVALPGSAFDGQTCDQIAEGSDGSLWITANEQGIFRLMPDGTLKNYLSRERHTNMMNVCTTADGQVFAGGLGDFGLLVYDAQRDDFVSATALPHRLFIRALCPLSNGDLLVGTEGNGLKRFDPQTRSLTDYIVDHSSFHSTSLKIHAIRTDFEGNLWLAAYQKGVIMVPASTGTFHYIGSKSKHRDLIGSYCITSLCRDHADRLWVGTDNDGIYRVDANGHNSTHYPMGKGSGDVPSTVFGLYEDSHRNIWFGSFTRGMGRIDPNSGRCTYLDDLTTEEGKRVQRVYGFAEDKQHRLWIATMGNGLYSYDLDRGVLDRHIQLNRQLSNPWIECIYLSTDGVLYLGTYDGINRIDLKQKELSVKHLLPRRIIHCFYEDQSGHIWVGSSNGLIRYNPQNDSTRIYTQDDGLTSNAIYAIQGDDRQGLWISTNFGLSQMTANGRFTNYYVNDGLQGNEFSKNTSLCDADGTLWFGGMEGISYFNPSKVSNPQKEREVRLTGFYLSGRPVHRGMLSGSRSIIDSAVSDASLFRLAHQDNAFSIELGTNELNKPYRLTYLYSLDNDRWIELQQGINRVSFSGMTPGRHLFRVKAHDGEKESPIREVTIDIAPPWYATPFAHTVYCLLVLLAIAGIALEVRRRYRAKQQLLERTHAEQINEAKLQFFINISHEIRTPMTLIMSPLQKLMSGRVAEEERRQELYNTIYRNAQRLLRLVNQLLDIRKIDKGRMKLSFAETDLTGFVNDLITEFRPQADQKRIRLDFRHATEEPVTAWIDPNHFDKIVSNLLSNALKFTPEEGEVYVELTRQESFIELHVTDNGIGIPQTERAKIFDRFYQIDRSATASGIGSGVGLHLTRSLVELHHGTIEVTDRPDGQQGTVFTVRIPAGCAHLDEAECTNAPQPATVTTPHAIDPEPTTYPSHRPQTRYRILLVEDDDEIRRYLHGELSEIYHVEECANGREALNLLLQQEVHLVISDVMMPEMDGFTLCRKIRNNPRLNHLPVVMLTAKTRDADCIDGLDTGADAYFTKPFNMQVLAKQVSTLIESRERLRNAFTGNQVREEHFDKIEMSSPDEQLMARIMKVINANLSNPALTIEQIAAEVGISRVHLNRKMKELTNQTTSNFIRNTRLRQAALLLADKHFNISEVADRTGFGQATYFSTAFKELYGLTPSEYAEKMQAKEATPPN